VPRTLVRRVAPARDSPAAGVEHGEFVLGEGQVRRWIVRIDCSALGMWPSTDIGIAPRPIAPTVTWPIVLVCTHGILRRDSTRP
jgi:hypothetical protein